MQQQNEETLSIEDITVMKLMEEIIEYDQEIKMKQKWVDTRMRMLNQIQKKQPQSSEMNQVMQDFMDKLTQGPQMNTQLNYEESHSERAAVTNSENAIPMRNRDVYPKSIPMDMYKGGPPIPLKTKDEVMVDQLVDQYEILTESFIQRVGQEETK